MRLIDADALKEEFRGWLASYNDFRTIGDIIDEAHTIDAEPVRHGRLERDNTRGKSYRRLCTACGKVAYHCVENGDYIYCPNCGAKMDGGAME